MVQRVSDLISLIPYNIRSAFGGLYVHIIQQKTKTAITVGVSNPLADFESNGILFKLLIYKSNIFETILGIV